MKKIFILKGISGCGKTTKINTIADWIINTYTIPNTIGLDPTNYLIDTFGILTIGKLKIGINSAGDHENQVKKIDKLVELSLSNNQDSDSNNDIDIIICACRTRGKGRKHITKNYNYSKGWLQKFINVEKFNPSNILLETNRDKRIFDELKTWLVGLEKK